MGIGNGFHAASAGFCHVVNPRGASAAAKRHRPRAVQPATPVG